MKKNGIFTTIIVFLLSFILSACNNHTDQTAANSTEISATIETETRQDESAPETKIQMTEVLEYEFETIAEENIDPSIYEMTGGTWFYTGSESEKSMDMDGLKGLTVYTPEAIPEKEGYLRYLGQNESGHHIFDVYDLYGGHYAVLTFISEEQFFVDDNENDYYIKWNY